MSQRTCPHSGELFDVEDSELAFYERVSPIIAGQKRLIPAPSFSPTSRMWRRMCYRNQFLLFVRSSSISGEKIFSIYPEEAPVPVVSNEEWWSDSWNGQSFGRDFDFSRPFFEQFAELQKQVPHMSRHGIELHNSDYSSNASRIKNCYFVFNTTGAEDCLYCENAWESKDCIDCTHTKYSELCYDCINCEHCYNLQSSLDCGNCHQSYFLLNCRGCSNCFGCVNLRHQEYCIFNEQRTRSEYQTFLDDLNTTSFSQRSELYKRSREVWLAQPRPHACQRQVESVTGNYIVESKNVEHSFFIGQGEQLRHCQLLYSGARDCQDITIPGLQSERMYECLCSGIGSYDIAFSAFAADGSARVYYSQFCLGCKDCFACVGLKRQQYCVFNKQYSEDEYHKIVGKLIAHMETTKEWGEFFPAQMTPFPYNYTLASRYFPMNESEARNAGFTWLERPRAAAKDAIPADKIPDCLPDGNQSLTVESELSGRPFKVTKREIEVLRKFKAPLPRQTYDERMETRAAELGSMTLYPRKCAKTGKEILSSFPPDSPWTVWDREVYEQEFSS